MLLSLSNSSTFLLMMLRESTQRCCGDDNHGDGGDGDNGDGDDGKGDDDNDDDDGEDDNCHDNDDDDDDLLVDDVEREDAEGVVALQGAGDTVLTEGALGHLDKGNYSTCYPGPILVI